MDKEAIREELRKVKAEIKKLKSDFSQKKDEKEGHFLQGEDYSSKINALYDEINKIESESGLEVINKDLDEKVKLSEELKLKLDELDEKFKSMKDNSQKKSKPAIKTISVEKAKAEIKKIDLKLQTQVLSLDKESELIKKIQELKGQVSIVEGNDSTDDQFKTIKKELNSIRRKFNNNEKKIRSLYKQIRIISKEKKKRYKEIDDLRDLKKKSFEAFRDIKKKYSNTGKELKDLFKKESDLASKLGEAPAVKKKSMDKEIRQKRKEAEDKLMKKGGVLTTDDLLMFQKH